MPELNELSEREQEILRLVATGVSNKEIARQLSISPNTVKVHLRNIFAKIGVVSRTEATLYAIRIGLAEVLIPTNGQADTFAESSALDEEKRLEAATAPALGEVEAFPQRRSSITPHRKNILITGGLIVAVALILGLLITQILRIAPPITNTPAPPSWQEKAQMPTARSGLAAIAYENQIYAIGGETDDGVVGSVERYDPIADRWSSLTAMPTPVTDVHAAVIGGQIYVPGGRLASGQPTDRLASYNPREDHWDTKARLPQPLSAYALVTFEGKLYVFGGWNGQAYIADVYGYDPDQDTWEARTPMPTARGFAAAAVSGSRIYVIGGRNAQATLASNEEYQPAYELGDTSPWQRRAELPEGRWGLGVTSVTDIVLAIGGQGESQSYPALQYRPNQNVWYPLELTRTDPWVKPGVTGLETKVYALGGQLAGRITRTNLTYQVVFTILLPIIRQ